jgi:hypothetical protein
LCATRKTSKVDSSGGAGFFTMPSVSGRDLLRFNVGPPVARCCPAVRPRPSAGPGAGRCQEAGAVCRGRGNAHPCTHYSKRGRRCGVPRSVLLHDGRRRAPASITAPAVGCPVARPQSSGRHV